MTLSVLWFNDVGERHPQATKPKDRLTQLLKQPVGHLRDLFLSSLLPASASSHYDGTTGCATTQSESITVVVCDGCDAEAKTLAGGVVSGVTQFLQTLLTTHQALIVGQGYGGCQAMLVANIVNALKQWLMQSQSQVGVEGSDDEDSLDDLLEDIQQYAGFLQSDLNHHESADLKAVLSSLDPNRLAQAFAKTPVNITLLDPVIPNAQHAGHWVALAPWVSQMPSALLGSQGRVVQLVTNESENRCFNNRFSQTIRLNSQHDDRCYKPVMVGGHHLMLSGQYVSRAGHDLSREWHFAPFDFAYAVLVIQWLHLVPEPMVQLNAIKKHHRQMVETNHPSLKVQRHKAALLTLRQLRQGHWVDKSWASSGLNTAIDRAYKRILLPVLPYLWTFHSPFPHCGEYMAAFTASRLAQVHRYNAQGQTYTLEQVPFTLSGKIAMDFRQRRNAEAGHYLRLCQLYRSSQLQYAPFEERVLFRKRNLLSVLEAMRQKLSERSCDYQCDDGLGLLLLGMAKGWLNVEMHGYASKTQALKLVSQIIDRLWACQQQPTQVYLQGLEGWMRRTDVEPALRTAACRWLGGGCLSQHHASEPESIKAVANHLPELFQKDKTQGAVESDDDSDDEVAQWTIEGVQLCSEGGDHTMARPS